MTNSVEKNLIPMEGDSPSASVVATSQAIVSFIDRESPTNTGPDSSFWYGASRVIAESDVYGCPIPRHRTVILLQWTLQNLYVLFACPGKKALDSVTSMAGGTRYRNENHSCDCRDGFHRYNTATGRWPYNKP